MPRYVPALALVLAAACGPSSPPEPFHGTWKVTRVSTPGGASSAPGAAAVGTEARYRPGDARFGSQSCEDPTYTHRSLSADTFAEAYSVTAQQLSIAGDPIAMVDVTCGSGALDAGGTLILKPDGSMLTMSGGVFYELRKEG
jgi:hypothetical protein